MIGFIASLYRGRRVIRALASREIASRYAATHFRGAWEVINPAVTVLLFWFVFSVAFDVRGPGETPFILYFVAGFLPWIFFADGLSRGTQGVVAHGFFIKKMVFRSELLPFVYLTAGAANHGMLLILALVVLLINGVTFTWHWFQVIYYFITLCAILLGFQWLLSAINVFNRDLGQGINVVLNIWFWATPVVWAVDGVVPDEYRWIIAINPVYYVVEGYRGSLLYHQPFWQYWGQGLYVWALALALAVAGGTVFRRLKPHFGDVL